MGSARKSSALNFFVYPSQQIICDRDIHLWFGFSTHINKNTTKEYKYCYANFNNNTT